MCSIGTTDITVIRTPSAIRPASTAARAGSIGSATRARRTPGRSISRKETDAQLVERLKSPNIYYRETAQRLLAERNSPEARPLLEKLVLYEDDVPHKARMHALWSLIGAGPLDVEFHDQFAKHATIPTYGPGACGRRAT